MPEEVPAFVRAALATPGMRRVLVRDGCEISYLTWGEPERPLVLLVHGRGANARWWDHVAPLLSSRHRIVAVDLSGHGDSGWRPKYNFEGWAHDVLAVAAAESPDPPVLVGHSMGSVACLTAAMEHDGVRGVALIDAPIGVPPPKQCEETPRSLKIYQTREEAVSRFRLRPADAVTCRFIESHIAQHSVRPVEAGWMYKSDPAALQHVLKRVEEVNEVSCPAALIRGERGIATEETTAAIAARLGTSVVTTVVPDVGHHVAIGQPVALVASLRLLLSQW